MNSLRDLRSVTTAVLINSMLWTAGNALTTGGFLSYFALDLSASGLTLALLMATPELVGIVGVFTRPAIFRLGNRKRTWLVFSIFARVVVVGIPLLAFPNLRPAGIDPLWIMIALLAVSQAAQSIAFVAYFSWLSDLFPKHRWGQLFALRQIFTLLILLVVPVVAGFARDWWRNEFTDEQRLLAYVIAFLIGIALLFAAIIPMLRLPNLQTQSRQQENLWRGMIDALRDVRFRWLCGYSWWLAFWSGLTQVAMIKFLYGPLEINLGIYFLLSGAMRLVQIPVCWGTGRISDRYGNKRILIAGVLATSAAMPFFLLASPQQWFWVFGAYVMWGGWGTVNVAAPNLMLRLAPPSDNTAHIALFRRVAGLFAGVSGILGGLWFDRLPELGAVTSVAGIPIDRFALLFLVSFIGRVLTVLWILPIREPELGQTGGPEPVAVD